MKCLFVHRPLPEVGSRIMWVVGFKGKWMEVVVMLGVYGLLGQIER